MLLFMKLLGLGGHKIRKLKRHFNGCGFHQISARTTFNESIYIRVTFEGLPVRKYIENGCLVIRLLFLEGVFQSTQTRLMNVLTDLRSFQAH